MRVIKVILAVVALGLVSGFGGNEPGQQVVSYEVINDQDLSISNRTRWRRFASGVKIERYEQILPLVTKVATDLLVEKNAEIVQVFVDLTPETAEKGCYMAMAEFNPNGTGWSGEGGSPRWDIKMIPGFPSDKDFLAVVGWYSLAPGFTENGEVDSDALEKALFDRAGLTHEEIFEGHQKLCFSHIPVEYDDLTGVSGWLEKALGNN